MLEKWEQMAEILIKVEAKKKIVQIRTVITAAVRVRVDVFECGSN